MNAVVTSEKETTAPCLRSWDLVRDIIMMGGGTAVAALFNAALIFLIPRILSVPDFGYWRLFLLYGGYVGFLHFGFADGALLRWVGRPLDDFSYEFRPAVRYLLWQHLAIFALVCAIVSFLPTPLRFVAIAVAIFAPIYNITATLQFGLQGARRFGAVAISSAASPFLFLIAMLLFNRAHRLYFRNLTLLYLLAWCAPLFFLLLATRTLSARPRAASADMAKGCILAGWPITIANTGVNLIQSADRLTLSWFTTIENFAVYSLAASLMALPLLVIQVCSKVFFSHLAGVQRERREEIYSASALTFLIVWAFLLPFYFALQAFLEHFLPRYMPALLYARVLFLAVPFVATIQILQMSLALLNGMQKKFLLSTIIVLGASVAIMSAAVLRHESLREVALIQVFVVGIWWLFNEWFLQSITAQQSRDWVKFLALYCAIAAGYWLTTSPRINVVGPIILYYLGLSVLLVLGFRNQLRPWFARLQTIKTGQVSRLTR